MDEAIQSWNKKVEEAKRSPVLIAVQKPSQESIDVPTEEKLHDASHSQPPVVASRERDVASSPPKPLVHLEFFFL